MAGIFHPTRGGNRGGKDQFKWEDVKSDKDRENYLGHSLMAPVGRWQQGKDLTWYSKDNKESGQSQRKKELDAVKDLEAQAMANALGYRAPVKQNQGDIPKEALKEVFKRGSSGNCNTDADRVHGMGYKRSADTQKSNTYGITFKKPDEHDSDYSEHGRKKNKKKSDEKEKRRKRKEKKRKKKKDKKAKLKKAESVQCSSGSETDENTDEEQDLEKEIVPSEAHQNLKKKHKRGTYDRHDTSTEERYTKRSNERRKNTSSDEEPYRSKKRRSSKMSNSHRRCRENSDKYRTKKRKKRRSTSDSYDSSSDSSVPRSKIRKRHDSD